MEYNKTFVTFTTNYGSFDTSFIPRGKDRRVNQPAGIAHFLEHKLFAMPDGTDALKSYLHMVLVRMRLQHLIEQVIYLVEPLILKRR